MTYVRCGVTTGFLTGLLTMSNVDVRKFTLMTVSQKLEKHAIHGNNVSNIRYTV